MTRMTHSPEWGWCVEVVPPLRRLWEVMGWIVLIGFACGLVFAQFLLDV